MEACHVKENELIAQKRIICEKDFLLTKQKYELAEKERKVETKKFELMMHKDNINE